MKYSFVAFVMGGFLISIPKADAPYCVYLPKAVNCWFHDAIECENVALRENGLCVLNQKHDPEPPATESKEGHLDPIQRPKPSAQQLFKELEESQNHTNDPFMAIPYEKGADEGNVRYDSLAKEQQRGNPKTKRAADEKRKVNGGAILGWSLGFIGLAAVAMLMVVFD